ncbi:MAG: HAMP domain-containing protein [Bosea sp.]|nr:HAMP domain-containing protein [Bosea sp. (in: a-proteobacteria)]
MYSLRVRLPAAMLALACLAAVTVGVSAYLAVTSWAREASRARLHALAESHSRAIERRLVLLRSELAVQARSAFTVAALDELGKWLELGPHDLNAVLSHYQGDGMRPLPERLALNGHGHQHGYSWRHVRIHETYAAALKQFNYADIYLVSMKGRVVYSATKGPEFGRLLSDPEFAGSGLAQVVEEARHQPAGTQILRDYAPYDLIGGEPRAFLAAPFYDIELDATEQVGTLVIAVNSGLIDDVLSANAAGRGEIGVYVVGEDGFTRSSPAARLEASAPSDSLDQRRLPSRGDDGLLRMTSHDGTPLVATGRTIAAGDWRWQLWLTEPERAAFAVVGKIRGAIVTAGLLVLAPLLGFAILLGWSVARPIGGLSDALAGIAAGRTDQAIPGAQRRDEIGGIARSARYARPCNARRNGARRNRRRAAPRPSGIAAVCLVSWRASSSNRCAPSAPRWRPRPVRSRRPPTSSARAPARRGPALPMPSCRPGMRSPVSIRSSARPRICSARSRACPARSVVPMSRPGRRGGTPMMSARSSTGWRAARPGSRRWSA